MEVITILMVLMDKSCSTAERQSTGANYRELEFWELTGLITRGESLEWFDSTARYHTDASF